MLADELGEYGIVANVMDADGTLRVGAKVWLCGGTGGEGWHRFEWRGKSIGGRDITKWAPTKRFHKFRAAWVPEHLRRDVLYMRGDRAEMEQRAAQLEQFAEALT